MMALLRFVILQTVMAAGLVALWMAGPLERVFASDAGWYVIGVMFICSCALGLAIAKQDEAAGRIRDMLPIVAVIAMQAGILAALAIMAHELINAGDPSKAVGGFFAALSTALYVSITALVSYLWLCITIWSVDGK